MRVKVTATNLNIRKYPNTSGAVLGVLSKGVEVETLSDVDGWYKIEAGYISAKYCELVNNGTTLNLGDRIISVARGQLGNAEIPRGSNWGKHVEKYLASVGITFPAAWCMGFVYWCVNEACKEAGIENKLFKSGGVLNVWSNTPKSMKHTTPKRGDIFIMDFGGGKGHTGIVASVEGNRIQTIEGNSNDEGSREGYEVCRKPNGRPISSIKGFIRLDI